MRVHLALSAAALLAASGMAAAQEELVERGEQAFQFCAACHEVLDAL
jgi:cytochrome c2